MKSVFPVPAFPRTFGPSQTFTHTAINVSAKIHILD